MSAVAFLVVAMLSGAVGLFFMLRLARFPTKWMVALVGAAVLLATASVVLFAPAPTVVLTPSVVPLGQELFLNHCSTCHGAIGQGSGAGPTLNDADWEHGSSRTDVIVNIAAGFPGTGCQEWAAVIGEDEIPLLADYVLTLAD